MQHEVTDVQPLLDRRGRIVEEGWARRPVWQYSRKSIKASLCRIKEWDYYAISSHKHGWTVALTISDLGYASLYSLSVIDYRLRKTAQVDSMKFFTFHKTGLSPSSQRDNEVSISTEKLRIAFIKRGEKRHLVFGAPKLVLPDGSVGINGNVTLTQPKEMESMNIATSWEQKRRAFYLNEKVNCMSVEGTIRFGEDQKPLEPGDVWGVLDWGRGRWTYQNRWFWGSGSGLVDGVRFGFNIGYGFSDRSCASENVIFYDGRIHKLDQVDFGIPASGYMSPWRMSSNDKRFEMTFTPVVDRFSSTNFGIIKSVQHQVFGYYDGTAVLDDGRALTIKDFPAFAEDVFNRW